MLGIGGQIDGTTVCLRNENVAIALEQLGGSVQLPSSGLRDSPERQVRCVLRPIIAFHAHRRRLGLTSNELHYPAERVTSVEVRGAPTKHLHSTDCRARHPIPIDPTAKWIKQRNAIFKD